MRLLVFALLLLNVVAIKLEVGAPVLVALMLAFVVSLGIAVVRAVRAGFHERDRGAPRP